MPCQWREDAGIRYLHLDYRHVPAEQYLDLLAQSVAMIQAEPAGATLVIEVSDTVVNSAFLAAVKRANHDVFGPRNTRKVYVGADDLRRRVIHGLTLVAPTVQGAIYADAATALAALHNRETNNRD